MAFLLPGSSNRARARRARFLGIDFLGIFGEREEIAQAVDCPEPGCDLARCCEDNEPTGLHVSNGSPLRFAQPGSLLNLVGARGFVTLQPEDNVVWEIVKNDD